MQLEPREVSDLSRGGAEGVLTWTPLIIYLWDREIF